MRTLDIGRAGRAAAVLAVAATAAACGGGGTTSPSSGGGATIPSGLSVSSFKADFSAMSTLTGLTGAGHGLVGVILPDTTSSTRYVDFDLPYLKKAFTLAGYSASDFKIDNAQGVPATELSLAQADITQGASVLVFDPLDSTTGSQIQALAAQNHVAAISYDRATFTGTNTYYASFDNVQVGKLIGMGFQTCVTAWHVTMPQVYELDGGRDSDPNAVSFAQGYNSVLWNSMTIPQMDGATNSAGYTLVHEDFAAQWKNDVGGSTFQSFFTGHPNINATVEANDGLGNAVIQHLVNDDHVAKKTVPTTGQDATLQGMENVLNGYQCGSVYKPVYIEAQDAVALATILRAGLTPPPALINGTTSPPSGVTGSSQPASLLTPVWVDTTNMAQTVIADQFVDKTALCTAVGAAACTAAGITP